MHRASFLVLHRHFALLLDFEDVLDESCGGDAEDELVQEFDDNPCTKGVRNFPSCRESSSFVWSDEAFDRRPTYRKNRVLRRAFYVI